MRYLNPLRGRPLKSNILFDYQQISSAKAFVYLQFFVSLHTESLQIFMIKTTNNTPSLFSNLSDMRVIHSLIILRSTQSSTNRHKSGPGTRFHQPYYPIYHS